MIIERLSQGVYLFVLKATRVDGHDFAEDAEKKGAVAILAEKELPLNIPVIIVKDTKRAMAILADVFMAIQHKN